jgi:hypothetical protein
MVADRFQASRNTGLLPAVDGPERTAGLAIVSRLFGVHEPLPARPRDPRPRLPCSTKTVDPHDGPPTCRRLGGAASR